MNVVLKNNAVGFLVAPIDAEDTSLVVRTEDVATLPVLTSGQYFYLTLTDPSGTFEIVKVTATTGTTFTIVRAQAGTAASSFIAGAKAELRVTAESIQDFLPTTDDFLSASAVYRIYRPGDASELFDLNDGVVATNTFGSVARYTQAGTLMTKYPVAIEEGRVYTYRSAYSRTIDSGDPANDGLQFGVDLLNGFGNKIGEQLLASDNTLLVQSGRRTVELNIARSALAGVDFVLPTSVRYVQPWVKLYGINHQTDIEVCEVENERVAGPQGAAGPSAEITVSGVPAVARTFYVTMTGNDNNDGTTLHAPLATVGAALTKAADLEEPAVVIVHPGTYIVQPDTVVPANCTLYGYDLRATKLVLPSGQQENNMFLLNSGVKVRGFTFSNLQHDAYTLTSPPTKGFAFAFNPGAVIIRSPYISDCSMLHNFTQDQLTLPIDKATGNPLMPRGGGNLYADGSVLSDASPLRSCVVDSFTAINPNGVGYLMRRNAFVQLVSVFTNWSRVGLWCDAGGQVTVANSNSTFGDFAFASTGFRNIVALPETPTSAPLGVFVPAADQLVTDQAAIVNETYNQLASEYVVVQNFSSTEEAYTRAMINALVRELADDLRSGQDSGSKFFVKGLFDWDAGYVFDPSLLTIYLRSYDIALARIKTRPSSIIAPAETMLDYLIALIKTNVDDPPTIGFPSVIEATSQQFSYAGSGVNYNALPTSQRGTGRAGDPLLAILKENGGKVYATFSTEVGDTYLGEDLRVDFERNVIEGQAFSRGVQNIALPLIIGIGG